LTVERFELYCGGTIGRSVGVERNVRVSGVDLVSKTKGFREVVEGVEKDEGWRSGCEFGEHVSTCKAR